MPPKEKPAETTPETKSETEEVDFSFITVNVGGRPQTVAWPSDAATAAGVVPCENGHPNVPDATTGAIKCGCGNEVASEFVKE